MAKNKEYRLKINAYTPETIPMHRLGEYMVDFANILGERSNVHFEKMETGSAVLKAYCKPFAASKIEERIRLVKSDLGSPDASAAFKALNKKMKEDNTDGYILENKKRVIEFTGIKEVEKPIFGPITQSSCLDGIVISVGGENKTASIRLLTQDDEEITCKAAQELVKKLGHYLYDEKIRLIGSGKWVRNEDGKWILEGFTATDFEVLEGHSLIEVIHDLRSTAGSEWTKLSDPWKELDDIRGGDQ